jgi:hypothetical protein
MVVCLLTAMFRETARDFMAFRFHPTKKQIERPAARTPKRVGEKDLKRHAAELDFSRYGFLAIS